MTKNCRHFDVQGSYSRKDAFEFRAPRTKNCGSYNIKLCESETITDPSNDIFIPPMSHLLKWQSDLQKAVKNSLVECYFGGKLVKYDINAVKLALELHEIKDCQNCVEKELAFLQHLRQHPAVFQNF